jgi:hypothetical protein
MPMLAPGVAGERHVALITADLFAVLLGQRDIEHQNEHVDHDSNLGHGLLITGRIRRKAAYAPYLAKTSAPQADSVDQ